MSETIEGLRYTILGWKEAFESKALKVNLGKIKVMVTGGFTRMDCLEVKLSHAGLQLES